VYLTLAWLLFLQEALDEYDVWKTRVDEDDEEMEGDLVPRLGVAVSGKSRLGLLVLERTKADDDGAPVAHCLRRLRGLSRLVIDRVLYCVVKEFDEGKGVICSFFCRSFPFTTFTSFLPSCSFYPFSFLTLGKLQSFSCLDTSCLFELILMMFGYLMDDIVAEIYFSFHERTRQHEGLIVFFT
jgi:hypothetical protein